jgi:hypothetical protein
MATVLGIWFAIAGVVPVVAGLAGRHRVRRLRRDGVKAWAVAVPQPATDVDRADEERPGERRVALQYRLTDGRVLDKPAPGATRKTAFRPGQSVLIWYDPADPFDILVHGRDGRVSDLMFMAAGAVFMLAGAGIAVFTP